MKKRWILLFFLLIGIGAAIFFRSKLGTSADEPKQNPNQPIAVILGSAEVRDVPIWLTGIGTAQASNTVTIRPRVSGALDSVEFTEGALVKKGDILARIDPRPYQSILAQAEAKKVQDEAQLANARSEASRFGNLLRDDAVSKQQADQAQASVAQLEALVLADDAAIRAAQLDLDFTTVRAPISGRTGVRMVDAGNLVTANQESGLVVLTELQPIAVLFTLPQQNLPLLSAGMQKNSGPLKVEALSEDGKRLDEGTLELIDNQIDSTTGTIRLKAIFKNENLTLWPGQFLSARVLVETKKNAIVIPKDAIQPGLNGQFCYVVKADQTVEVAILKPGASAGDGVIIEEGLKGNEKIVVTGQLKLKPGSKVRAQEQSAP